MLHGFTAQGHTGGVSSWAPGALSGFQIKQDQTSLKISMFEHLDTFGDYNFHEKTMIY